jgi:hypothetical protein
MTESISVKQISQVRSLSGGVPAVKLEAEVTLLFADLRIRQAGPTHDWLVYGSGVSIESYSSLALSGLCRATLLLSCKSFIKLPVSFEII